jgi:hypothetical protein
MSDKKLLVRTILTTIFIVSLTLTTFQAQALGMTVVNNEIVPLTMTIKHGNHCFRTNDSGARSGFITVIPPKGRHKFGFWHAGDWRGCGGTAGRFQLSFSPSPMIGEVTKDKIGFWFDRGTGFGILSTDYPNPFPGKLTQSGKELTFTTAINIAPKKKLTASKPQARWSYVCGPICNLSITETVTKGSSTERITSREETNAITTAVSLGFDFPGGSASASIESTNQRTASESLSRATSSESSTSRTVEVRYTPDEMNKYNIGKVWQWIAETRLSTGSKVLIKSKLYTCTPGSAEPTYLPGSAQDDASCTTEKEVEISALEKANIAKANLEIAILKQQLAAQYPTAPPVQAPVQAPAQATVQAPAQATVQAPAQAPAENFTSVPMNQFAEGLPANPQAACESKDQQYLFFQGDNIWSYNNNNNQVNGPISTTALGLPGNLDAAVNGHNGKMYFFQGSQYWRYDIASDQMDKNYPKSISAGWPGLPNRITSAVRVEDNKLLFFSGDTIYSWDMSTDTIIPGVYSVSRDLPGLPVNFDAAISANNQTIFFGNGQLYIQTQ